MGPGGGASHLAASGSQLIPQGCWPAVPLLPAFAPLSAELGQVPTSRHWARTPSSSGAPAPRPIMLPRVTYPRRKGERAGTGVGASGGWVHVLVRAPRPCPETEDLQVTNVQAQGLPRQVLPGARGGTSFCKSHTKDRKSLAAGLGPAPQGTGQDMGTPCTRRAGRPPRY